MQVLACALARESVCVIVVCIGVRWYDVGSWIFVVLACCRCGNLAVTLSCDECWSSLETF